MKEYIKHPTKGTRILDITGKKNGKLTAIKLLSNNYIEYSKNYLWLFKCDCGNYKEINPRQVFRKDNYSTKSCGCLHKEYIKNNKGTNSNSFKGVGEVPLGYYTRAKIGAIKRNLDFKISIEDINNLLIKQNNKCKLSNVDIYFKPNKDYTASLDRIDSTKGYTIDNIQWIHKTINVMKMKMSDKDLIDWCKLIANNN